MARVVSFEMSSQDPERSAAFYAAVFGWEIGQPNWGYYPVTLKDRSETIIKGGIAKGPQDFAHGTRIQIEVKSIDETIKQALQQGAQLVREKMVFDEYYLAYLVDPVGIGFGLIEQKEV